MTIPTDISRFEALVDIIAHLRSPQGCPWDRQQTHQSLRKHLLEEAYEVLESLDEGDNEELCVELGDLLMQIVMHARLAEEDNVFTIEAVITGINKKLISRHPHVFNQNASSQKQEGQDSSDLTAQGVLIRWEELKKQERRGQGGMLDGIPHSLPSLAYSQSVQERVARIGFDWPDDNGVLDKLAEELAEFHDATTHADKTAEFGDILFTLVNYARRQGIDPETALREANAKFYRRFSRMEDLSHMRGFELDTLALEEMNQLWEEAKKDKAQG